MAAATARHEVGLLFFVVILVALCVDQYTKYWILQHLGLGQFIPMGFFDIRHVHNMGAAFGMLQNAGFLFVFIAVVVLVALLVSLQKIRQMERTYVVALGLIAGGTVGNLIDRLRFGYVVDFIDLRWWPVFNVADSCICVGVGLLVWKIFTHPPGQGDEVLSPPPEPNQTPPAA